MGVLTHRHKPEKRVVSQNRSEVLTETEVVGELRVEGISVLSTLFTEFNSGVLAVN
jgi:hypothetical protein